MRLAFYVLIILVFCFSCKEKIQPSNFNLSEVQKYIESQNQEYSLRFSVQSDSLIRAKYTEDACIMGDKSPRTCRRENIMNYYFDGGKHKDLHIIIKTTTIYGSEDLVVEEGIYDLPDGKGGSMDKGKFMALWKQEENTWKLFREIWNSDLPTVQ